MSHEKLGLWLTSIKYGLYVSVIKISNPKISKQLLPKKRPWYVYGSYEIFNFIFPGLKLEYAYYNVGRIENIVLIQICYIS